MKIGGALLKEVEFTAPRRQAKEPLAKLRCSCPLDHLLIKLPETRQANVRYALEPLAKLRCRCPLDPLLIKLPETHQANVRYALACRRDAESSQ